MKLDLQADRVRLREYIQKRIRDYADAENLGPGNDADPIRLITLGYYAEQGGYANLVFDTRINAEVDGEWTLHIDNDTNTCLFPDWVEACESIFEGESVSVRKHDGTQVSLLESDGDEEIQSVFGDMIVDLVQELLEDGTFQGLPLATDAYLVVEEFDGRFFFPTYETRKTVGRIAR